MSAPSNGARQLPAVVRLGGLDIHSFTPEVLVTYLIGASQDGVGGYLMTPNVDHLRWTARDPEMLRRAVEADLRVADGMPLIWASRIQGTPLPARVAGSDLTLALAHAIAEAGRTLFLLGGSPGSADKAAEVLCGTSPKLRVVGTMSPPAGYEHDPAILDAIADAIAVSRPDFVYLGLPLHKSSALALQLRTLSPASWFLGVGVSFSFIAGDIARAPEWMQHLGLEWLHRLRQEPRRLFRRYLLEDLPFAVVLLSTAAWRRLRAQRNDVSRSNATD